MKKSIRTVEDVQKDKPDLLLEISRRNLPPHFWDRKDFPETIFIEVLTVHFRTGNMRVRLIPRENEIEEGQYGNSVFDISIPKDSIFAKMNNTWK